MLPQPWTPRTPITWAQALRRWLAGWREVLHFGAQVLVLAVSRSSWRRTQRVAMLHTVYRATMPLLPGFTAISAIVALVVIRIVLATALSYGLSRYALEVLVRTLVLELIPLSAALYAALRYSMPAAAQVRAMRLRGEFETQLAAGRDPMRDTVLPRAVAGMFAVVTLATASGAVTLVLAYFSVYGFAAWGLAGFTHTVGQVFSPVIALIFCLKTLFFGLAVSIVPMVPTPREASARTGVISPDITRLARLLAVIVLIEMVSLVGNYY